MSKTIIKENLLYVALWVILFLTPIISNALRMAGNSNMEFNWHEVFFAWKLFVPYLLVFVIHNYWMAPLLVYKKRNTLYLTTVLCLIAVFTVYQCNSHPRKPHAPFAEHGERHDPFNDDKPPFDFRRPHEGPEKKFRDGSDKEFREGPRNGFHDRFRSEPPPFVANQDIIAIVVLVLMLGMNLGIKVYFKSSEDSERMKELEKKNLEQQLEYLKYQINPHFFMNTLNNIHALVDIEPEQAKHSIVELSKMMRYVLHEGTRSQVALSKDLDFLHNYIALMRLRYTDKVTIHFETSESLPDRIIPPMLLITFVENAFKHGVSYKRPSFIEVNVDSHDDHLLFTCRNSKVEKEHDTQGGVGLANTKKRLSLIYGEDYDLQIDDGEDTYSVRLDIPFLKGG